MCLNLAIGFATACTTVKAVISANAVKSLIQSVQCTKNKFDTAHCWPLEDKLGFDSQWQYQYCSALKIVLIYLL